tara:strand:+ start:1703 stop:2320 length:618 start_codon:yes stop_codon:yes gene_type:complete
MKKSQLRHIIRESIKELMNEQGSTPAGRVVTCRICNPQTGEFTATQPLSGLTINGNPPQVGDLFRSMVRGINGQPGNLTTPNQYYNTDWIVVSVHQPTTAHFAKNTPGHGNQCCQTYYQGVCNATPTGTSGCDQSAWSNYTNWSNNWTNLGPFNSSNPNQPCNFICNKIQQWNNALTNAGPVQANQLNCKLDVAQQQEQIHNCNC